MKQEYKELLAKLKEQHKDVYVLTVGDSNSKYDDLISDLYDYELELEDETIKEDIYKLVKNIKSKKVDIKTDVLYGFFRKPTFTEFREIYPLFERGDNLLADKRLLEFCWLGGDNEIYNADENVGIFLSVKSQLGTLIEMQDASLKKK